MRSAPPVLVPVGHFVLGHALTAALAGLVGLAMGGGWLASGASALQGGVCALLYLLLAAVSWHWARREALPEGALSWDGEHWHWTTREPPDLNASAALVQVAVRVLWDAGPAMLVAVRTQAGAGAGQNAHWHGQRFAWLHAAHMPGQWHAWRCAVYADDIL